MTEAAYRGQCACGSVRVEIAGEPAGPYQCCCSQCRQASGGGPATFVIAPAEAVRIDGPVSSFAQPTASGNHASRSFCPRCGTAVFSEPGSSPGRTAVKLSMFAQSPWDKVAVAFWTDEAPAWVCLGPDVRTYPTQP